FLWYTMSEDQPLALSSTTDGSWIIAEVSTSTVPEPSTYGLLFGGLALAVVAVRRRKSTQA
ncbi:PEP-CTERM sorting domain-containing protein, partial [bacterium]|nr:PEP-CTERM sorting domain-containing protein [bacterium]